MAAKKIKKEKKEFWITVHVKFGEEYKITTETLVDAKKKAFAKFKRGLKMKDCTFYY
jgi:hypothetical protein